MRALGVIAAVIAGAVALAGWLTAVVAERLARPVEELADAAARLGTGDPRPVGRRYGVTNSTRWPTAWTAPPAGSPTC